MEFREANRKAEGMEILNSIAWYETNKGVRVVLLFRTWTALFANFTGAVKTDWSTYLLASILDIFCFGSSWQMSYYYIKLLVSLLNQGLLPILVGGASDSISGAPLHHSKNLRASSHVTGCDRADVCSYWLLVHCVLGPWSVWLWRGSELVVRAAPRDSCSFLPPLVFSLRGLGLLKTNRGR